MYNIVNRAEETGSHHDRHRSGRPKGSSTRDDSLIVRQSLQDRRLTVPDLGKSWELSGVNVSNTTVRRRLQGRWAAKKPFLTPKLREKCLAFDRAHPDWTLVDWSTVLFTNEGKFSMFSDWRPIVCAQATLWDVIRQMFVVIIIDYFWYKLNTDSVWIGDTLFIFFILYLL